MTGVLLAVAGANALVVGLIAWAMSRRYGSGRAMVVPVVAMLAAGFMLWRSVRVDGHDPLGMIASGFLIAGPWVVGAFLGLAVARWQGQVRRGPIRRRLAEARGRLYPRRHDRASHPARRFDA